MNKPKVALITGVTGQDGAYLSELLLDKGYEVHGIKLCESYNVQHGQQYICAMPTNLYGPNDSYDLASNHVLPALIRKAHEALKRGETECVVWGTGTPRREFLHVDDLADACVHLMAQGYDGPPVNIGTGEDVTIGIRMAYDGAPFRSEPGAACPPAAN